MMIELNNSLDENKFKATILKNNGILLECFDVSRCGE